MTLFIPSIAASFVVYRSDVAMISPFSAWRLNMNWLSLVFLTANFGLDMENILSCRFSRWGVGVRAHDRVSERRQFARTAGLDNHGEKTNDAMITRGLDDVVALVSRRVAVLLVNAFPGVELYIPARLPERHELYAIGVEEALGAVAGFGVRPFTCRRP